MYIKNPPVLDKIHAAMNLLFDLKEEFDGYLDKSLFFQDPRVIKGWLLLAGEIKEIKIEDGEESDEKWEQRSEPYAASLIARRDLFIKYKGLYRAYYDPLYNLWMNYSIDGECISADAAEALKTDHYDKILQVEDIDQYIEEVNSRSIDARYFTNKTLTYILNILQAIMDNAGQTVIDLKPTDEEFAKAIDDDLRGMTRAYKNSIFKDMKEDLTRHFKAYRTAPYTPELWGEMLSADEEALSMASKRQLTQCDAIKQEHWGEDMKELMDKNGELMHLIYSLCRTEELLDLRSVENVHKYIELLTSDNLSMFYEIIVRRNLIQCEMYPELKAQHNEWLNLTKIDKKNDKDEPHTQIDSEEGVNNEEPSEEERFHFIHVEIEDDEAWHIHRAIKRLVAIYNIPEICAYLKEQKQNGKLMLPSNPKVLYNELVRLGMPTGDGFSEKNFSNIYKSSKK